MASEWYKKNPELGLTVCDEGDCDSHRSLLASEENDREGEVGVEAEKGQGGEDSNSSSSDDENS
jgi:hypothetical protein